VLTYYGVGHGSGVLHPGCPNCIVNKIYDKPLIIKKLRALQSNPNPPSYCACSGRCNQLVNPPSHANSGGQSQDIKCKTTNCRMYIAPKCQNRFDKSCCCYCILLYSEKDELKNWYFGTPSNQRKIDNDKAHEIVKNVQPKSSNKTVVKKSISTSDQPTRVVFANKFDTDMDYGKLFCLLRDQKTDHESYANDEVINYIASMANESIDQKNVILMRSKQETIKRFYLNSLFIQSLCFDDNPSSAIRKEDKNSFNYLKVGDIIFPLFHHCSILLFLLPYF
jgi:hypothetical protein